MAGFFTFWNCKKSVLLPAKRRKAGARPRAKVTKRRELQRKGLDERGRKGKERGCTAATGWARRHRGSGARQETARQAGSYQRSSGRGPKSRVHWLESPHQLLEESAGEPSIRSPKIATGTAAVLRKGATKGTCAFSTELALPVPSPRTPWRSLSLPPPPSPRAWDNRRRSDWLSAGKPVLS